MVPGKISTKKWFAAAGVLGLVMSTTTVAAAGTPEAVQDRCDPSSVVDLIGQWPPADETRPVVGITIDAQAAFAITASSWVDARVEKDRIVVEPHGTGGGSEHVAALPSGEPFDAVFIDSGSTPIFVTIELGATIGAICTAGGDDVIDLSGAAAAVYVDSGPGRDKIRGSSRDDSLHGGPGSDHITGGDGNDLIDGGHDDDTLIGGAGPKDRCGSTIHHWTRFDSLVDCELPL